MLIALLVDSKLQHDEHRAHMSLSGAAPATVRRGEHWPKPALSARRVSGSVECRLLRDTGTTAYRLAA
jgi:hypothetical protein